MNKEQLQETINDIYKKIGDLENKISNLYDQEDILQAELNGEYVNDIQDKVYTVILKCLNDYGKTLETEYLDDIKKLIQVLDEIQGVYASFSNRFHNTGMLNGSISVEELIFNQPKVYQMPKDDDKNNE